MLKITAPVPTIAGNAVEWIAARGTVPYPAAVAAMDGWAVRAADTPGLLRPAGESAAVATWYNSG